MTKLHLLWWIFDYLRKNHPGVIDGMREELAGDAEHPWVAVALEERLQAFKTSLSARARC